MGADLVQGRVVRGPRAAEIVELPIQVVAAAGVVHKKAERMKGMRAMFTRSSKSVSRTHAQ